MERLFVSGFALSRITPKGPELAFAGYDPFDDTVRLWLRCRVLTCRGLKEISIDLRATER